MKRLLGIGLMLFLLVITFGCEFSDNDIERSPSIVQFDSNGGIPLNDVIYSDVSEGLPVPIRTGFLFAGWYMDSLLNEPINPIELTEDLTLYARWTFEEEAYVNMFDQLIRFPEEVYDVGEAERMIERIARFPLVYLETLVTKGVLVYLTNTNVTGVDAYAHLSGVVPRGWEDTGKTWDDIPGVGGNPVVARIGYSHPGSAHGTYNLEMHEVAHVIDDVVFSMISYSTSFIEIWEEEAFSMFVRKSYYLDYPEEYFAETLTYYYYSEHARRFLYQRAPKTHDFLQDLELLLID